MSQLQFRSLAGVALEQIHATFLAAFADYAVPMQLDLAGLSTLLTRRGYVAALSAGAFDGERLLAFHLICRGQRDGLATVYDTASGVLPEARGQGLSRRMFEWLAPRWQVAGIAQAMLEVLVDNQPARRSYQAVGFVVSREFDCLELTTNKPVTTQLPNAALQVVESNAWPEYAQAWFDVEPAWQNSTIALLATPQAFKRFELWLESRPVALGMLNPVSGEVPLFAVDPSQRRRGLGRALLGVLLTHSDKPLSMINLLANSDSVQLLRAMGAYSTNRQLEMCWRFSLA